MKGKRGNHRMAKGDHSPQRQGHTVTTVLEERQSNMEAKTHTHTHRPTGKKLSWKKKARGGKGHASI